MQTCHRHRYLTLIFLLTFCTLGNGQTGPAITEPRLTSVIPINSTALTVNWQFADPSIDTSDLIRISIVFHEYYYSYVQVHPAISYTFTPANKTVTSVTRSFELVNAYYYVCFSSNSTVTNVSQHVAIVNNCVLTRTCFRSNLSCPAPASVTIVPASISSTSFLVAYLWPTGLPYSAVSFAPQLTGSNQTAVAVPIGVNSTFTNYSFRFSALQPSTTYTVNASFTYAALYNVTRTNSTLLTVTTSRSSKRVHPSALLSTLSVILFAIFV